MVQSDHTVPVPGLDLKPKHGTMGLFYFFKSVPEQFFLNERHMAHDVCVFILIAEKYKTITLEGHNQAK